MWELIVQLLRDPVSGKYKQMSRVVRGTRRAAVTDNSPRVRPIGEHDHLARFSAVSERFLSCRQSIRWSTR